MVLNIIQLYLLFLSGKSQINLDFSSANRIHVFEWNEKEKEKIDGMQAIKIQTHWRLISCRNGILLLRSWRARQVRFCYPGTTWRKDVYSSLNRSWLNFKKNLVGLRWKGKPAWNRQMTFLTALTRSVWSQGWRFWATRADEWETNQSANWSTSSRKSKLHVEFQNL